MNPTEIETQDPYQRFSAEAERRWKIGVAEYRGGDASRPFNGDPFREFQEEILDASNYVREMVKAGSIGSDEERYLQERLVEFWVWADDRVDRSLPPRDAAVEVEVLHSMTEAEEVIESLRTRVDALHDGVLDIMNFVSHRPDCGVSGGTFCDCGLGSAVDRILVAEAFGRGEA